VARTKVPSEKGRTFVPHGLGNAEEKNMEAGSALIRTTIGTGVRWLLFSANIARCLDLGVTFFPSNQQLHVMLDGGTGQWHQIQASTNLVNWCGLTNLFPTNPVSDWVDPAATNLCRFYRSAELTPLDVYVAAPDTNFSYTLVNALGGTGQTTFVLGLNSQTWRKTNEVDRILWKHWLIVTVPTGTTNGQSALLFISAGANTNTSPPTGPDPNLLQIGLQSQTIVAELRMVPNEPLTFASETNSRSEDALIAYTWDKFLRTGDYGWPAQLPMTKAAVRAMDAVTAFAASSQGGAVNIQGFVVTGLSKRGWTTWLAAAIDNRVQAIIPMVFDALNTETCFIHQYCCYGFWPAAVQDYVNMHIMNWFGTSQFHALMGIADPYTYRARLIMPKFMINASGDQFFPPDSAQFYFGDLIGQKFLRYVPNTSHDLGNSDAWETVNACYQAILKRKKLPRFSWVLDQGGNLRVMTESTPTQVKLWQATNTLARDFRLATIGSAWQSSNLLPQNPGTYIASVPPPAQGWTAYFVELTYPGINAVPLKFTTQVYVVPNVLPYHYPP
jgi:PhoPQ-activated pathogenicity-related protein